jgi:hypothetical protein
MALGTKLAPPVSVSNKTMLTSENRINAAATILVFCSPVMVVWFLMFCRTFKALPTLSAGAGPERGVEVGIKEDHRIRGLVGVGLAGNVRLFLQKETKQRRSQSSVKFGFVAQNLSNESSSLPRVG